MTNEEAIAFLEQYINSEVYTEKCISAHEMAITALRSAHAGEPMGYHFPDTTKMVPLTLEQLRRMECPTPVWAEVEGKTIEGWDGYWCLCHHGRVLAPGNIVMYADSVEGVAFYDYPPAHIKGPCQSCGYGGKHLDAPPCTTCPAHPKIPVHIDREEWVSVEERLPEDEKDGETVLVIVFGKPHENITLHGAIMTAGYFRDEGWVLNEYPEWEGPEVTHWMPLPSPPAELEKRLRGVRA